MNRPLPVRDPAVRASVRRAFETLGYEVIPFKGTEERVVRYVPKEVRLTVTASPAKGQDATIELGARLARHGYDVTPHLSARQVKDRAHLTDILARCREAGITGVFVVGGDRTDTPTTFRDSQQLLIALHELGHPFAEIGVAGHPEGHPAVTEEALLDVLGDKAPLATHITTQICFDPRIIVAWARVLVHRGIRLPVRVGLPGAVHRQKLLRVASGLGLGESARFLQKHHNMIWRFFVPGGYRPSGAIKDLAQHISRPDNNIEGFHIFTFNDIKSTEAWRRRMLESLA